MGGQQLSQMCTTGRHAHNSNMSFLTSPSDKRRHSRPEPHKRASCASIFFGYSSEDNDPHNLSWGVPQASHPSQRVQFIALLQSWQCSHISQSNQRIKLVIAWVQLQCSHGEASHAKQEQAALPRPPKSPKRDHQSVQFEGQRHGPWIQSLQPSLSALPSSEFFQQAYSLHSFALCQSIYKH